MNYPVANPILPPFPTQEEDQGTWLQSFQKTLIPWLSQVTNLMNNSVQGLGPTLTIASNTIYPTHAIHHVADAETPEDLETIALPSPGKGFGAVVGGSPNEGARLEDRPPMHTGPLFLIPDDTFVWSTAGNIALAGTAVVDRVLMMVFDGTSWHPNYLA